MPAMVMELLQYRISSYENQLQLHSLRVLNNWQISNEQTRFREIGVKDEFRNIVVYRLIFIFTKSFIVIWSQL